MDHDTYNKLLNSRWHHRDAKRKKPGNRDDDQQSIQTFQSSIILPEPFHHNDLDEIDNFVTSNDENVMIEGLIDDGEEV